MSKMIRVAKKAWGKARVADGERADGCAGWPELDAALDAGSRLIASLIAAQAAAACGRDDLVREALAVAADAADHAGECMAVVALAAALRVP